MSLENEVKAAMEAAIDHLRKELKGIRTGRANPALLDSVTVEVYGTKMRLRDVANITVPESRQLLISPFDPSNTSIIGKGIESANLNVQPIVEANIVRIVIPSMDETVRKDMVKLCKKKGEDGKVAIREVRRKYNDLVRKQKTDGELPEDMMKSLEKKIQEFTDKYCKEADLICVDKEKEITEI
jgi:ribosome recycling factor